MGVGLLQAERLVCLGVEGGGTRTTALLADARGKVLQRLELGPLNLKLSTDTQVVRTLRHIRRSLIPSSPALRAPRLTVCICLAGCRAPSDKKRLRNLAARVFPGRPCFVGSDLDSGFAAAFGTKGSGILVLSGTGSCVFGRNPRGQTARAGGWGHLLGDHGSAYWIAMTGLRAALREYDRRRKIGETLPKVLRKLALNGPDELTDWVVSASKADVAALAPEILKGNRGLMLQAASFLALDCAAVAKELALPSPSIALAGGLFAHHQAFYRTVAGRIRKIFPDSRIFQPKLQSAHGALLLAGVGAPGGSDFGPKGRSASSSSFLPHPSSFASTEQRNPRTLDLDKRSVSKLIDTMLDEESRVIPALRANKRAIARAINAVVAALNRGGRLFYVGAGTSGRLGVLDASECPPTFSTDPERVQGIIAGGAPALHSAVEGAEDDPQAGATAIGNRRVGRKDIVVGIAASGSTPFVLGALDEARRRGAKTFLLCFSRPNTSSLHHSALFFDTGPEVITGSTRLKAGTATKLVLNMLTTISMIRLDKVVGNLMVDVKPTNKKLRARACRIVATLRGCSEEEAWRQLIRHHWNVKEALSQT